MSGKPGAPNRGRKGVTEDEVVAPIKATTPNSTQRYIR
jgi:hypothetical protein